MAAFRFPPLKITKEDIKKLLNDEPMKGFNRLAIQFYRRKDDKFTLVAMLLDARRHKVSNTPVIFIEEDTGSTAKPYETSDDVMFFQHELTKADIIRLSDHGNKDINLTPKKLTVNPDGVTYEPLNPSPPAPPPEP